MNSIRVYTDGSCHTQQKIGSWAAILIFDKEEVVLKGLVDDTTHNRMELMAVIKAIQYTMEMAIESDVINIFSDSQYVVNLVNRRSRLEKTDYLTHKGVPIKNPDLIKVFYHLIDSVQVSFCKVIAHQKEGDTPGNYNRKVDKLVRKTLREYLKGRSCT